MPNKQSRSRKEHIIMTKRIAGIAIPESKLSTEAADALREYGTPLLWNHSHRVFLFGSLLGRQENLKYDPELLYMSALFHDLGLTSPRDTQRGCVRGLREGKSSRNWQKRQKLCLLYKGNTILHTFPKKEDTEKV